ncbi:ras-specific guanine nucleotide-releasing factor RalGPS1 isoform X2 [Stomoxys calcitrans]|uniref:Ras-GEF domain-containing protein n=1 Tax=Stomoxys calcitrans TaxID=35570 RepID=A0A1I8PUL7_STOCA|nr:ras-specific guanine nucleotide-releasing factor RalGPS1 isoform X2 [Stomoxys calcitrans]
MMRYSEISRDLSSDNLRYVEFVGQNDECTAREASPMSDVSNGSGPLVSQQSPVTSACRRHRNVRSKRLYIDDEADDDDDDDYGQAHNYDNISLGNNRNNFSGFYAGLRSSKRFSSGSGSNSSVNGTANGAATIAYVRQRKDSTKSTQSCRFDAESPHKHNGGGISKSLNIKGSRRKHSIGCLNAFSSSPDSPGNYYGVGAGPPSLKSHSLPGHTSTKSSTSLDATLLSALRIPADELANQLTLLDFPVFAAIQPDELTSCAWTKKDKHTITPNIVAFTKRFNHTSFWVVQEILSGDQPKQRAEILAHFIKVAKKLHELNNLHSLFAIISAMQSASIYRLKKTWAYLAKKDKHSYERLSDIFSDQNNWENLRAYLESLRLPCIPYLGLFLTDLIYIDLAYPQKNGIEPEQRRNRMNNILRVISNYQESNYTSIMPKESTQKYLTSIRYIEELQNIFEEEQYKKSLKLEPISPLAPSSSSCSSKESFNVDVVTPALACLNLSPAKTVGSVRLPNSSGVKFIPGHRKCRSLGTNIFGRTNASTNNDGINASINGGACSDGHRHHHGHLMHPHHHHHLHELQIQPRHLLDDSVLEQPQCGASTPNGSLHTSDSSCHLHDVSTLQIPTDEEGAGNTLQGCVRRKTVQKEGRKPAVASWQRYYLQIWANSLVYFPPKSFKGSERSDFKREPCKVCPLEGWFAQVVINPKHKNTFELYHRSLGTIYKFRTDSPQATQLWCSTICKIALQQNRTPKALPVNLMSFE